MPFGLCRAFGSGGLAEVVKFVLAGVSYREPVVRSTLVHFEVRGAKNDFFDNFTKSRIFRRKMIYGPRECCELRENRKMKSFILGNDSFVTILN